MGEGDRDVDRLGPGQIKGGDRSRGSWKPMKEMLPDGAADPWCQKVKGRRLRTRAENSVLEAGRRRQEETGRQGSRPSERHTATGRNAC